MMEVEKMNAEISISQSNGYDDDANGEENVLNRVANLPVVSSTWNVMQSYYTNVKKNYPTVSPYLEAAESLTVTAANIAMVTSRPVVDKLAPTVNSYANIGLDKLEDKVPMITKHPEEIYENTKSSAVNILTSKVNNALSATEKYVDYYLPSDDEHCDDDYDTDSSDECSEEVPDSKNTSERIKDISNKVRRRSYKQAVDKWRGVHARSKEALTKLVYTVDLIQYAQDGIHKTSANIIHSANEKIGSGVQATFVGFNSATDSLNKMEGNVLGRAQNLTVQLNRSCSRAMKYVQNSPQLHHMMEQAKKAKEATEDLYRAFANKSTLAQMSSALVESTRPKLKFVEETLLQILEKIADQPPMAWLTPDLDIDPLDGVAMEEIEAQLYDRPRQDDDVERRSRSPVRKQG